MWAYRVIICNYDWLVLITQTLHMSVCTSSSCFHLSLPFYLLNISAPMPSGFANPAQSLAMPLKPSIGNEIINHSELHHTRLARSPLVRVGQLANEDTKDCDFTCCCSVVVTLTF